MSGNYFKQDGILKGTDATRLSYRINANHQVSTRLKVGENLNFTHSERNNFLENHFTFLSTSQTGVAIGTQNVLIIAELLFTINNLSKISLYHL